MKNKCDCLCHILPSPTVVCKFCDCIRCLFCEKVFSAKELENHYYNCKKEFIKNYKVPVYTPKDLFMVRVKDNDNEK